MDLSKPLQASECTKTPCASCPFRKDIRYMTEETAKRNLRWLKNGLYHHCHNTVAVEFDKTPEDQKPHHCAGYLLTAEKFGYHLVLRGSTCEKLGVSAGGIPLYDNEEDMLTNGVIRTPEDFNLGDRQLTQAEFDIYVRDQNRDSQRFHLEEFRHEDRLHVLGRK